LEFIAPCTLEQYRYTFYNAWCWRTKKISDATGAVRHHFHRRLLHRRMHTNRHYKEEHVKTLAFLITGELKTSFWNLVPNSIPTES